MSNQKFAAAASESSAAKFTTLTGHLFDGFCELSRLNLATCRSIFAGSQLHIEGMLSAQTPEQFVRSQLGILPWVALQAAGYTRACMDIASETAAKLR
ncbi:phasin family protein [Paraburkholderia sp. CNPSo 3076]|uniref:phasin family protein n=1 Tax=Paraburkholderia sp. CNPSo 3076 TaxID=2940936 RepID=UPI002253C00E|nr:phasin family protein [Paraburkholderia sp. CNPSo 3076]MCX5539126.1 phasin family protein [Paraburkholderia sp. CNPSo 3076]